MREESPKERLRRTSIKQIPPSAIDWTVQRTTPVSEVKDKLIKEPQKWFIPIVKSDGSLETVLNEEAVWRFLLDKSLPATATVKDLLDYVDATPELKRFSQVHVTVPLETTTVGTATELMDSKQVFLVIVESSGKPTHFFTTSEVRKLLLEG